MSVQMQASVSEGLPHKSILQGVDRQWRRSKSLDQVTAPAEEDKRVTRRISFPQHPVSWWPRLQVTAYFFFTTVYELILSCRQINPHQAQFWSETIALNSPCFLCRWPRWFWWWDPERWWRKRGRSVGRRRYVRIYSIARRPLHWFSFRDVGKLLQEIQSAYLPCFLTESALNSLQSARLRKLHSYPQHLRTRKRRYSPTRVKKPKIWAATASSICERSSTLSAAVHVLIFIRENIKPSILAMRENEISYERHLEQIRALMDAQDVWTVYLPRSTPSDIPQAAVENLFQLYPPIIDGLFVKRSDVIEEGGQMRRFSHVFSAIQVWYISQSKTILQGVRKRWTNSCRMLMTRSNKVTKAKWYKDLPPHYNIHSDWAFIGCDRRLQTHKTL